MRIVTSLTVALLALAAATVSAEEKKGERRMADPYWTLLRAPDRTDEDRKNDETRKPLELLRLLEIKRGAKALDIGAGGGYTTELLARAVGPTGTVYSQNNKMFHETFKDMSAAYTARLATPANKNVVKVERELDDPIPPEARDLDVAINAFLYHDTVWLGTDREKMNKAIFSALKPGGIYVILDHSGRDGSGITEVKSLHRIEEKVVVDEITKAGFQLARKGDFLRNPADPRDANVFGPLRGKTDRFVLVFQKPKK